MIKKNKISSWQQFEKDFGEFPPIGIKAREDLKSEYFYIIKMTFKNNLKTSISEGIFLLKCFFSGDSKAPLIKDRQVKIQAEKLRKSKKEFLNIIRSIFADFKSKSLIEQSGSIARAALLFVLLPFVFIFIFVFVLKVFLSIFLKSFKKSNNAFGYMLNLEKYDNIVYVNQEKIINNGVSYDEIVTHEHMHIRQEVNYKSYPVPTLYSYDDVISHDFIVKKFRNSKNINYLMTRRELEVRINELLVCYYRKTKVIPLSYLEFLKMLLSFNFIHRMVEVECPKVLDEVENEKRDFTEARSIYTVSDVFDVLLMLQGAIYLERFIKEVLPVMYCHLLFYYSDEKACLNFYKTIPCVNMFEEIYGKANNESQDKMENC